MTANVQPAPSLSVEAVDFLHDQAVAASSWVIDHNLGRRPAIGAIIDSAGTEVHGQVTHPTENQTVLTFAAPFSGKARLL